MTDGEFAASCQMVKPAAIVTVPMIPNQAGQPRSRASPGRSVAHSLGILESRLTASAVSRGAAMSNIGTGANAPPNSSGRPGTSQDTTAIAGRTVSLANARPARSLRRAERSRRAALSDTGSGSA